MDLVDLETRLAYAERTLEELNDLVYRQQQMIDRLIKRFEQFEKRLTSPFEPEEAVSGEFPRKKGDE